MKRFLVNGASCTTGYDNPNLENWGEMIAEKTGSSVTNLAVDGASNERIIRTTLEALTTQDFDAVMIVCPHVYARREFILPDENDDGYSLYTVAGLLDLKHLTEVQKRRVHHHYRYGNDVADYFKGLNDLYYLKLILRDSGKPYYLANDIRQHKPLGLPTSPDLKNAIERLETMLKPHLHEQCMFNFFTSQNILPSGHPDPIAHGIFADHLIEAFLKPSGVL